MSAPASAPLHVLNVMLSKGGGGIEQASLDYARALAQQGCRVTMLTHPRAWANTHMPEGVTCLHLPNRGWWDALAILRLARMLRHLQPTIAISHTNRALQLLVAARWLAARARALPIVAVAHNFAIRHHPRANAVIAITQQLQARECAQGIPASRVFHIPNMVAAPNGLAAPANNAPPVIGSMGRFMPVKGYATYLEALALLKQRGVAFNAVLGGSRPQESALRTQATALGLDNTLQWAGWVNDRTAFYAGIDVFCLPSQHESFGIVVIEAFAHGVPVVATPTAGPSEIISHGKNGLLATENSATALADALQELLQNPAKAQALRQHAFTDMHSHYSQTVVGKAIVSALQQVVGAMSGR